MDKVSGYVEMVKKYPVGALECVLRGNSSYHYIL